LKKNELLLNISGIFRTFLLATHEVRSILSIVWRITSCFFLTRSTGVPLATTPFLKGKPRGAMTHPNARCRFLICLSLVLMKKRAD
jgi:hypothetical protein